MRAIVVIVLGLGFLAIDLPAGSSGPTDNLGPNGNTCVALPLLDCEFRCPPPPGYAPGYAGVVSVGVIGRAMSRCDFDSGLGIGAFCGDFLTESVVCVDSSGPYYGEGRGSCSITDFVGDVGPAIAICDAGQPTW